LEAADGSSGGMRFRIIDLNTGKRILELLPEDDLPGCCVRLNSLAATVCDLIDMVCTGLCLLKIVALETKLARHCRGIELEAGL
jgi:hypothetical protein